MVRLATGLISSFFRNAFCGRLCAEASVCLKRAIWLHWSSQGSTNGSQTLWKEAVERSKKPLEPSEPRKPKAEDSRLEQSVIAALRLGDVRKALQMLNSAPIAAKTPATLANLRKLHPNGENPAPIPHQEVPHFTEDVVRKALCSFGPGSAAGLFGYKPFLLQQCVRAESFVFTRALTSAVNEFACGRAPAFLKRYVAGGVSIALEKTKTSVRPLACGDPIRRLVAKCFCVAGKEEISKSFAGRNYRVGCPGGVEVVAHSLRDCTKDLSLLCSRLTFAMLSTRSNARTS